MNFSRVQQIESNGINEEVKKRELSLPLLTNLKV